MKWTKSEYIDIETGEILNFKEIKNHQYEIIKKETKILKDKWNVYKKTINYIRIGARQRTIW